MELTSTQARQALTMLRIALGGAAWLMPRVTARVFGIDPEDNPAAPFIGRLFGARNLAMAAALLEGDDAEVDRWLTYGVATDAADVVAALAGGLRGYLPKRAMIMAAATAAAAVALGLLARQR